MCLPANPTERRRLVETLLSNCTFDRGTLSHRQRQCQRRTLALVSLQSTPPASARCWIARGRSRDDENLVHSDRTAEPGLARVTDVPPLPIMGVELACHRQSSYNVARRRSQSLRNSASNSRKPGSWRRLSSSASRSYLGKFGAPSSAAARSHRTASFGRCMRA